MISPPQQISTAVQFGHTISMPSIARHAHPHHRHTLPVYSHSKNHKAFKNDMFKAFSKVPFNQYIRHYGRLTQSFFQNLYQSARMKAPKQSHGEGNFLNSVKVWIEDFMSIMVEDVKRLWKFLTGDTGSHRHTHNHSHNHDHD